MFDVGGAGERSRGRDDEVQFAAHDMLKWQLNFITINKNRQCAAHRFNLQKALL